MLKITKQSNSYIKRTENESAEVLNMAAQQWERSVAQFSVVTAVPLLWLLSHECSLDKAHDPHHSVRH